MDNKTKVKVAVVIAIVILAVIFVFMVVFVKGNKPKTNKNIPKLNGYAESNKNIVVSSGDEENSNNSSSTNLDKIVSLGIIKDKNLVKINSDLEAEIITELGIGYSEFCYGDNKVYIVFNNQDRTCSIEEIDLLKSDYPKKTIMNTDDYGAIKNIDYYAGKIYFISEAGQLIEYSIVEEYSRALTNENEVGSFAIDKNKNIMYLSYKQGEENAGIYILDFTANTLSQIIALNELPKSLIFNGSSSLVIDVSDFNRLYVYNSDNNSIVELGPDNYLSNAKNHVAFYDNVLLYTDGSSISIKDKSGNSHKDNWYTLGDKSIASISMIDSKTVQIARLDENGTSVTRSIIIDLSNGATTEVPNTFYTEIVRIK